MQSFLFTATRDDVDASVKINLASRLYDNYNANTPTQYDIRMLAIGIQQCLNNRTSIRIVYKLYMCN